LSGPLNEGGRGANKGRRGKESKGVAKAYSEKKERRKKKGGERSWLVYRGRGPFKTEDEREEIARGKRYGHWIGQGDARTEKREWY